MNADIIHPDKDYSENKDFEYISFSDNNENSFKEKSNLSLQEIAKQHNLNKIVKNFLCNICTIYFDGQKDLQSHINGVKHKRQMLKLDILSAHPEYMESVMEGEATENGIPVKFNCKPCALVLKGVLAYDSHVSSNKHKKTMKKLEVVEQTEQPLTKKQKQEINKQEALNCQLNIDDETAKEPIKGMEFIVADKEDKWFQCTLCSCRFSQNLTEYHLMGKRHASNHKKKFGWSEEVKESTRTEGKKSMKAKKQMDKDQFWKNNMFGVQHNENKPAKKFSVFDDKHLYAKFRSITIEPEKASQLMKFVENCEKALKSVSDEILKEDLEMCSDLSLDFNMKEERRVLKSVMRVGNFFQGTMFKGENLVECVILTMTKPTTTLLQRISQFLADKLKDLFGENEVLVQLGNEEIVVSMAKEDEPAYIACIFRITSPSMNEESTEEDVPDVFNKEACVQLLRVLRRCKWFQVCLSHYSSASQILTIMREFCSREETWNCLDPWIIELLLEKAYSVINKNHGPSAAFRTIFEMIASGIFLSDGPGLVDPCEKEQTDVLAYLTDQQKEDITKSAQQCLREQAMRQIFKVLNIAVVYKRPWHRIGDKKTANYEEKRQKVDSLEEQPMLESNGANL